MNDNCRALGREAALAAEHLAIGVTALGRANYAQEAYYGQAFFALTVGLERSAKLAFVVDYALDNAGKFPPSEELTPKKGFGHDIKRLLDRLDDIAERRGLSGTKHRLPRSEIHDAMIDILSDFARNGTRYYNLEFVTGTPSAASKVDPLRQWWDRVVTPILRIHYKTNIRRRHEANAEFIERAFQGHARVRHESETGHAINSVYEASRRTGATGFAAPYVRVYVMQIIRFLATLLSELGFVAQKQQLEDVPYLADYFAIFQNDDKYFKRKKTWSIYTP